MVKSPLRYPGGKSRAVKIIEKHVPYFEEYREPFVGGGSLFFYLRQKFPNKVYWINDLFEDLYLFYKHMQKNPYLVLKKVRYYKNKYEKGKELYEYLLRTEGFDEIEKASAFFILNRITFSGTTRSGGYSEHSFKKRFTESSIERLEKIIPLMDNVKITNFDYEEVINASGENVFIFLDPPYFKAQKTPMYGNRGDHHRGFDYERLAKVLSTTRHKWIMTIDDSEYIRSIFDFAYISEWDMVYTMRNGKKQSELFVSNYF